MKEKLYIGIDPGIVSGFAIWNKEGKKLEDVKSYKLHELFSIIKWTKERASIFVYIENPNTWVQFRNTSPSPHQQQGAGGVKQTYKHIVEFLTDHNIEFVPTKLQGNMKKVKADYFKTLTGYQGKTNEHGRDAALLVFRK